MAAPILALAVSAAPSALARTLWLQGHPAEALHHVMRTVRDAASADHPVTLLVALIYAITVLIWNGDFDEAEAQIARFIANAESYSLQSHVVLGRCFQGQLAISRGDTEAGLELLRAGLNDLHRLRYGMLKATFSISLVQAFGATGRFTEGTALIKDALRLVEVNGDFCSMPEILRVKARLLLAMPRPRHEDAEVCLAESLAWSRRQGALAWELRTSIDLARRLAAQKVPAKARELLQPVLERFREGSNTADLRAAGRLLATLNESEA